MPVSFPRSVVIDPAIEARLRGPSGKRHCVYIARLVASPTDPADPNTELPLPFMYPSGVLSSIVNIGEGESFVERWLAIDKAKHVVDLAGYLHVAGVSELYGFRIIVDAFAIDPQSRAGSIELMLERSFMAACHCPPFFQELRGSRKKVTQEKEARLYLEDYEHISNSSKPTSADFTVIEKHVMQYIDTCGSQLWKKYRATADAFFKQCVTTRNDVSVSFKAGNDAGYRAFGSHVVTGISGELPTGKGNGKHQEKVACYKLLQDLSKGLSTRTRTIPSPLSIPVGQNGKHGTLELVGTNFQFTDKHGRSRRLS
jgi:hypothetical protein